VTIMSADEMKVYSERWNEMLKNTSLDSIKVLPMFGNELISLFTFKERGFTCLNGMNSPNVLFSIALRTNKGLVFE
jgi:hypothetical protein